MRVKCLNLSIRFFFFQAKREEAKEKPGIDAFHDSMIPIPPFLPALVKLDTQLKHVSHEHNTMSLVTIFKDLRDSYE